MADIRVTHSGRIFYRVDDAIAALLVEALPSVFERAKTPAAAVPPTPTEPVFFIAPSAHTGNLGLHARKPNGETTSVYSATSKAAAEAALAAGEMPQAVWDDFANKTSAGQDPDWHREQIQRQTSRNKW